MKELLKDGCDPNIITNNGETLLIDAIRNNKINAIKLLLKYDCHTSSRN
jgi:ankyrin repeat protein